MKNVKKIWSVLMLSILILTPACNKKMDPNRAITADDKRRKNIEEGRGASIGSILGNARGSTNYEFSTSNPLWRASLETLDFLPLTTVDYSGGVIITDWYSENANNSLKITIRFLSNQIRSDSIKIIVHKKDCKTETNCIVKVLENSLIHNEIRSTILKKASLLKKSDKKKK